MTSGAPGDAIRVASVPAGHPYVAHLADPDGLDGVVRLPDPPVPGAPPGQWWPSPALDAGWVAAHAAEWDLLHIHFGFEGRTPIDLANLVAALRRAGRPLVVTVHDLSNPHTATDAVYGANLRVLVCAAHTIITLTPAAAEEIAWRFDRRAVVVPHPHLVPLARMVRPRPAHDGWVVGLHAKSERAANDSVAVARVLARAVADLPGARLRVDAHDDDRGRAVAAALGGGPGGIDVRVHPRFDDEELWAYLAGLDASVLPYRFGTHSGWMEACHDLGTAVIAPDCGCYADQGPCDTYGHDRDDGVDAASLVAAVGAAHARARSGVAPFRWSPDARRAQRREVAAAHLAIYREALAGGPPR